MTGRTDRAWVAGVFETTGSILTADNRVRLQTKRSDRDLLDRIQAILGGTVYGPYANGTIPRADGSPRKHFYVWNSDGGNAMRMLLDMRPYLGGIMLVRTNRVLDAAAERFRRKQVLS